MSQADREEERADPRAITDSQERTEHLERSKTGVEVTSSAQPSALLQDPAHTVGQILADRYLVKDVLGTGGMGTVYSAEHVHMKKPVALKVLHPEMSARPEIVARFEREAVAAGRLQHPGIVGATDFGRLRDGSFYLVLEHVDGCSLAQVMRQEGVLSPERALRIGVQINSALSAAHAAGIIHRDLKPDNVMLVKTGDDEDFVKVLDFGIAKIRLEEGEKAGLTQAGVVFGTPEYMAPEQALGHEADARSDLYALGMILYEMCAGQSPFRNHDLRTMLAAQITEVPPPLPNTVPERFQRLIYRLLEKNPDERHQSAAELGQDLARVAERLAWVMPAPRTSAGTRLDALRIHVPRGMVVGRGKRLAASAIESFRSFSMQPVAIGKTRVPRWIPIAALVGGAGVGVFAMLTQTDALSSPQEPVIVGEVDVEAQLLSDARQGDREAIGELRKLTEKKQLELPVAGVGVGSAPQTAPDQDENHPALAQVSRYLALGRGYSAIKHPSAALAMYQQAVMLDPHVAGDPDLLVDVRVALSSPDAVQEGMDFALEHLGSHGADLIYDVYLDHLGQAGMTPVVARAMKEVNSKRLFELATPALQVALRLANSKACAEYRLIIPDAAANGDDRSLQKLRALLSRRGCGTYGNKDCFVCLRSAEVPLEAAVQRAETHPSPVFLTPAEEARESVPNATADE